MMQRNRKGFVLIGTVVMVFGCMASSGGNNDVGIGVLAFGFIMLLVGAIQNVRYGQRQRSGQLRDDEKEKS